MDSAVLIGAITTIAALTAPIITTIINNSHENEKRKMDVHMVKKIEATENLKMRQYCDRADRLLLYCIINHDFIIVNTKLKSTSTSPEHTSHNTNQYSKENPKLSKILLVSFSFCHLIGSIT